MSREEVPGGFFQIELQILLWSGYNHYTTDR
jgi:hypothetical protein